MNETVGVFEIILFTFISSFFSLGGGNGQIAVIQSQWIESGALDPSLFAFVIGISYLTPGPKAGFLSGVGYYLCGIPGAIAAMIGILIPTSLGASAVAYGMNYIKPLINRITLSANYVISGVMFAAAWGIAKTMHLNQYEILAVILVAIGVARFRFSPALLVLGAAGIGLLWGFFV